MTISFVGSAIDASSPFTPAEAGSPASGDFMLLFGTIATVDGTWTVPGDFTVIDQFAETAGAGDMHVFIAYKIRGADAGSGYNCSYSGTAGNTRVLLAAYRGDAGTLALDVTYVKATHYDATLNNANAAAKAIDTATNGAMVILAQMISSNALTGFGPPSGYTQRDAAAAANASIYLCDKIVATAGTETPGVYTHTAAEGTQDQRQFTIAISETSSAASKLAVLKRIRHF